MSLLPVVPNSQPRRLQTVISRIIWEADGFGEQSWGPGLGCCWLISDEPLLCLTLCTDAPAGSRTAVVLLPPEAGSQGELDESLGAPYFGFS